MRSSENEVEARKQTQILSKYLLHIVLWCIPFIALSQKSKEEKWKYEKDYLEYRKGDKYKGPDDWYGSYPASMQEEDVSNYGGGSSSYNQGIQYSPQQIRKDRRDRYQGYDRGGGNGTVPFDPEVQKPDPIEVPDIDAPDIDVPDVDIDAPTISPAVWKFLMFLLIFVILFIVIYLIVKNRKPSNKKVIVEVENDWNPEVITKTELELKLEEAMAREDYRECIRIYFTFILKELIRKSWIAWKKEKTNYHYVLEMHKRPESSRFNECVRIYDLVWYGEYHIDKEIFEMLKPTLENYYKSLEPLNE